MKRFLLVDDHTIIRSAVGGILSQLFSTCEVHEANTGDAAVEQLKKRQYDLVVMDIHMPGTDTLGLMEYMHVQYPDIKVLIFSMSPENIFAKRFLKAGAQGFISKDASLEEITKAINIVLSGRKYISPSFASYLADNTISGNPDNPFDKLSAREFEVVNLLLTGKTVSDISKTLNLQVSTIGTHKARLFEKLGVSNLIELKELANNFLVK
jgi:two-component system, NarL family, invasion response regulator UvrY